jgi:outer membrane scaffolding protein for murein synthesis (MipA/OmpV family)
MANPARMRATRGVFLASVLVAAAALFAVPAAAQTPTALTNWQLSVGELLVKQAEPVPEWRVTLGGGIDFDPIYEGAKRYRTLPSLVFDIRYRDLFFVSDGEGLGVNILRGQNYRAGVAIGYDLGRDHHLQHRLAGLGNVDPTAEAKIFAEYFFKAVVLNVDLRKGIGGNSGLVGDVGFYVPLQVPFIENFYVFTGPSVTLADHEYMDSYFSVTSEQSARSIFPVFNAHAGLYKSGWGVTAIYDLSDNWWLEAEGAWQYLLGGAAASPIVEDRSEFNAGVNVIYRF